MAESDEAKKYFDQLPKIQELILTSLYKKNELEESNLKKIVATKYKNKYKQKLNEKFYSKALLLLVAGTGDIIKRKLTRPGDRYKDPEDDMWYSTEDEDFIFYRITAKGITEILKKDLKKKDEEVSNTIAEIVGRIESQTRDVESTKQEISDIKENFDSEFNTAQTISKEVGEIRDEIDIIRKEFYGRILQIFGIFVAIFSFIIVGFDQAPNLLISENPLINIANLGVVFACLMVVLTVLLLGINIIIKTSLKNN